MSSRPSAGCRSSSARPAAASATTTTASGTLMMKIQRHDTYSTSTPPSGGPATVATAVSDVQRPIARPASSAQTTRSNARLVVVSAAAPTP